jgi:hypothetical protein
MKLCHLQENEWNGDHHVKQEEPSSQRHISHFHSYAEPRLQKYIIVIRWTVCVREPVGGRREKGERDK